MCNKTTYTILEKNAGFNFEGVKSLLSALHNGARATHTAKGIDRAGKMISNYAGETGMGWRVNAANNKINKLTPILDKQTNHFNSYITGLSPEKAKWATKGKNALGTIYDVPKMLAWHPGSTMGMMPFIGVTAGAAALGLKVDPYARAGQAAGMVGAGRLATEAGTVGGTNAANDLINGFDNLSIGERMRLAGNPKAITNFVNPEYTSALRGIKTKGFDLSGFLKGNQTALDGEIRNKIAEKVTNFKL